MLITSFQSNCVPGVSSVSEDIDNFRRNRSRGCGFVQNCLKSLIIKDKHLWSRMWKPSTFMRENLKFIHRWLKVIHKPFRKDQLSTARPHGFHFLLWIDLLFQEKIHKFCQENAADGVHDKSKKSDHQDQ